MRPIGADPGMCGVPRQDLDSMALTSANQWDITSSPMLFPSRRLHSAVLCRVQTQPPRGGKKENMSACGGMHSRNILSVYLSQQSSLRREWRCRVSAVMAAEGLHWKNGTRKKK